MKRLLFISAILFSCMVCQAQDGFYKITKLEAILIGEFEYAPEKMFSPFVGEQKDGTYLVSEKMYAILKDTEQFKRVDFANKQPISKEQVDMKNTDE